MIYFSVIIPLFNKEKFIEATLRSVLEQSFTNFEIIIVNDGSTDTSEEIVLKFNDARIKCFSKKNEGVSVARNYGIQQSKGVYIALLDADDLWFPNHLEVLNELIYTFPEAGLYASRYISKVSEYKHITNNFLKIAENFSGIVPDFFYSSLISRIALTSAVAIPKSVLNKTGLFNPNISSGQDLDLWIKIALFFPVAITNSVTVEYNTIDSNSLSKTNIRDKNLIDFSQFQENEKNNPSLKAFIDVNRMDYALKFKISGDLKKANEYYKSITKENITVKNWIVFHLPRWIQIPLLRFKKKLYKNGIYFSVYR
ncbi:glycosyltransferase family 2 protein [Flavobacterium petrolei]|jgi:glycosyltransferase involved in cell wall biosynthesis|uniref:glycosyltransferase family 2 protein n=1 Tax=Flavobacterium petrolei TaxID=2259594 RepID=UPI0037581CDA